MSTPEAGHLPREQVHKRLGPLANPCFERVLLSPFRLQVRALGCVRRMMSNALFEEERIKL
jgi:hypothetical protein